MHTISDGAIILKKNKVGYYSVSFPRKVSKFQKDTQRQGKYTEKIYSNISINSYAFLWHKMDIHTKILMGKQVNTINIFYDLCSMKRVNLWKNKR